VIIIFVAIFVSPSFTIAYSLNFIKNFEPSTKIQNTQMPLFKEEEITPTLNVDLSTPTLPPVKKVLAKNEKRYIPADITIDDPIMSLDFHPEHDWIAIGSVDGQTYIYKYCLDENELVANFQQHVDSCREVCFSDNGKYLLSVSADKSINSINLAKEKMQFEITNAHDYPIHTFIVCNDQMIASGDDEGYVKIWDLRAGKCVHTFEEHSEYVSGFDYDPDRNRLYSTSGDGTCCVMDLRRKKVIEISKQYNKDFLCVCSTVGGTRIGCGTMKGDILLFDSERWEEPLNRIKTQTESIDTMCYLADNRVAVGSSDGTIKVYSFHPSMQIAQISGTSDEPVYKMKVNPSGDYIASCGSTSSVKFWNASFMYGKNLVKSVELKEATNVTEDEDEPKPAKKQQEQEPQQQQQPESEENPKKRKKNTEKIDVRKRKKIYNNKSKAFFHDLCYE
jgi:WD40 repeat protein